MSLERLLYVGLARFRGAHEQRLRGHDHPAAAVAALTGLLADERPLQHTWLLRSAQPLDRRDPALAGGADGIPARALFNPIDWHTASAAVRRAEAYFSSARFTSR